jgi:hypothetical protein
MNKLKIKIRQAQDTGIFHNSREDVRRLAKVVNVCIDKINELVCEVERLKQEASNE